MSKRKKHGYVECLKYIHMIQEGVSIHSIHVKYGINEITFMYYGIVINQKVYQAYRKKRISRQIMH